MSDTPHATSRPSVPRRLFSLATSVPAMAFLACALLVDAMLLPNESACRLWPRQRAYYHTSGFGLVRTQDQLHPVLIDAVGVSPAIGMGRFYARTTPDPCFWAPLAETLRVEIIASLDDRTAPTAADIASIGHDLAELRVSRGYDDKATELLRLGGGSERRLLVGGCVHNLAASLAFVLVACGTARAVRSELRSSTERRRLARDQCPLCGYPRTGGPPGPCPECGRR